MLLRACRCSVTVLALVFTGCAGPLDPTTGPTFPAGDGGGSSSSIETGAVGSASTGGFYPLQLGNRWSYVRQLDIHVIPNANVAPPPPEHYVTGFQREVLCTGSLDGVRYTIERTSEGSSSILTFYRQTSRGLYEYDGLGMEPQCEGGAAPGGNETSASAVRPGPTSALRFVGRDLRERIAALEALIRTDPRVMSALPIPGTVGPNEITRLRYPLELKSRWTIRDHPGFRFGAEVVGLDELDLPAGRFRGYRIRLESNRFGPRDAVHVWYGRSGYLQLVAHLEGDWIDEAANIAGRAIYEQRETLADLHLVETEIVALPPWLRGPRK